MNSEEPNYVEWNGNNNIKPLCVTCGGDTVINVPRLFVSQATGIGETVIDTVPCKDCKNNPGFQNGPNHHPPA